MVCILFGEISIFHSRVMGLYSSNCRWFFVCRAVNWEPFGQFTSNFTQLLELMVLRSVYFLVKFRFFIQELWERKSTNIVWMLTTGVSCTLGVAVYSDIYFIIGHENLLIKVKLQLFSERLYVVIYMCEYLYVLLYPTELIRIVEKL